MLDLVTLNKLSQADVVDAQLDSLVDISTVTIDTTLPAYERLASYLAQIQNPYCFKCGAMKVKVNFAHNGRELKDKLKDYFVGLKREKV